MAEPVLLAAVAAWALLDGPTRPEIGDVVTIAIRDGAIAFELKASVVSLEEILDGEVAILVDDTGCRWAMPVPTAAASAAAA